jgi:O-antigen/teichoic acid export membrane protein
MESSVKKNLAYNFIYQILAVVLPLITTPYISRVLGPTKLGEYSYSYAIAYYFVMITMLGLNNYGNRSIAMVRDDRERLAQEFSSIYFMQLATGLISLAVYIAYGLLFSNATMTWVVSLYVISAIFDINWFFFGMEQFKLTVTRNSFIKVATTLGVFIFVKKQEDIYIYGLIMVVGILASQMVLWPFLKRYTKLVKVSYKDVVRHIKPNLILFIPIVAVSLYKVMDKIMLGALTTKTEVGLYEASERVIQIPMAFIQSMGTVMLPKMTNLIANNDEKKTETYFSNSIMLVMFLSASLCFGIMGCSRYFVPLYYGDGYLKCVYLFQILLPSCVFLAFANVIRTQYLIPRTKDRIFITSVIMGAVVNLLINILLIPRLASVGAAIGTLIAEVIVCVYQAVSIRKEIPIEKNAVESLIFVVPAIIMYLLLLNVNPPYSVVVNLLVLIVLGACIYCATLIILLFVTKKTYLIRSLIGKVRKK